MRKIVLLLVALFGMVGANAQNFTAKWEKPAPPKFTTAAPEDTIYMWNVGLGGFWANHQNGTGSPYWGTAASVNDTLGCKVIFTKNNPAGEDEGMSGEGVNRNTYLLVNYVTKFGKFMCCNADGWVWTDNNENYRFFDVTFKGEYITFEGNAAVNLEYSKATNVTEDIWTGNLIGAVVDGTDKMVRISSADAEFHTTWAAVSPAEYDAYMPGAKAKAELYMAATALRATIEKAVKENPGISLDAQVAVYNNTASTVAQLKAAEASVADAVVEYRKNQASPENPSDFTAKIVNPNFDNIDTTTGWSGDKWGAGGTKD